MPLLVLPSDVKRMPPVDPLPVSPLHHRSVPVVVTADRGLTPAALNRVDESIPPRVSTRAIVRLAVALVP